MFKKILYYLNPYRWYYRVYYYLFATRIIANPKPIIPFQQSYLITTVEIDPECRKHKSFIYANVKPLKWTYWRRSFAFREIETDQWYQMPKLTPWSTDENGRTQFGLNYTFCQKHKDQRLEFLTWKRW